MEIRTAFRGTVRSKSLALVFMVLTAPILAAGAIASSGQVRDARAATIVQLTYTKWFSPSFPTMTGFVGGDIVGSFGGTVLEANPIAGGRVTQLKAVYEVIANDPSQSFTALVEGQQNNETSSAVLNGVVTSGFLTGERVHAEYNVLTSCPGNPSGPCFQGTIRVG
jgi:hypothetical protein